ncbi:MAG: CD20-like domain-containing protein [Propionibacteriaceae bacterium]|jgi:hypothetical protein|nr:CD20-like domain-containing protein [Propionibacteriaceae bacterium]
MPDQSGFEPSYFGERPESESVPPATVDGRPEADELSQATFFPADGAGLDQPPAADFEPAFPSAGDFAEPQPAAFDEPQPYADSLAGATIFADSGASAFGAGGPLGAAQAEDAVKPETQPKPKKQRTGDSKSLVEALGSFGWAVMAVGAVAWILAIASIFVKATPWLNIAPIVLGLLAALAGIVVIAAAKGKAKPLIWVGAACGVVAVFIAGVTWNNANQPEPPLADKYTEKKVVEYSAAADYGTATVVWGSSAGTSTDIIDKPWDDSGQISGDVGLIVTVIGDAKEKGKQVLTCEIKLNGEVVATQKGSETISCTAPAIKK